MNAALTKIIHEHTVAVVGLDPSEKTTYGMLTVNTVKAIEELLREQTCSSCKFNLQHGGMSFYTYFCSHGPKKWETTNLSCRSWEIKE